MLRTPIGMIELAPEADHRPTCPGSRPSLDRRANGGFVLIGRRHLRSNNSWMHNINVLVKGKPRCTLQVHPDDAARLGLNGSAKVSSRAGAVIVPVEVTDAVMPGVVSACPTGGATTCPACRPRWRAPTPASTATCSADEDLMDPLSGNAVLNGIPVEVAPA